MSALSVVFVAAAVIGLGLAWSRAVAKAQEASPNSASPAEATTSTRGKATLGYISSSPVGNEASSAPVKSDIPTTSVQTVMRPNVLQLTGVLVADEESEIASNVSGIVLEVRVDRGSMVKKGDVLARLDPVDAQNDLAEGEAVAEELKVRLGLDQAKDGWKVEDHPEVRTAKAGLDLAVANYARLKELSDRSVISKADYDQAEMEGNSARERYLQAVQQARQLYQSYQTALTRLRALRKAVDDTTIMAPFSGWVAEKHVAPGERITVGMPDSGNIALLVRIDPIRLSLTVPQQSAGLVKAGQKVVFRVDAFPDRKFTAATRYISPSVDNSTRSLIVQATAANPDGLFRPGMFATAELQLEEQTKDMFVPSAAVRREGDVARLFVARQGVVREVVVSAGEAAGSRTKVLSGLDPTDVVVLAPQKVKDGDRIR